MPLTQANVLPSDIPIAAILDTWEKAYINIINASEIVFPCPCCKQPGSTFLYRWHIIDQFGLFDNNPDRLLFIYGKHPENSIAGSMQVQYLDAVSELLSKRSYVDYRQCHHCGLVFQNYPHTLESTLFYYRDLYRLKEEWIAPDKNMALFGRNDDRWVYQQELIGQYFMKATGLKKGAKVLDIGCAEGLVCKYLENQGISAYGVEPCIPMANYARSILGLKNISCCDYTSETYAAELFDGIVTHHVLEHIVAIPDFFNAVQKQIKSGGYLLLQTPCLDHLHLAKAYQRILSGGHLYAFSESFLRNMLLDRHFEILDCKKTPLDLSELDPAERAAWNTTVWADDPGGISFLAQKNGHL